MASIANLCFFGFGLGFLTLTFAGLVQGSKSWSSSAHTKVAPGSPENTNFAFLEFVFFFGPLLMVGAMGPVVSTVNDAAAWVRLTEVVGRADGHGVAAVGKDGAGVNGDAHGWTAVPIAQVTEAVPPDGVERERRRCVIFAGARTCRIELTVGGAVGLAAIAACASIKPAPHRVGPERTDRTGRSPSARPDLVGVSTGLALELQGGDRRGVGGGRGGSAEAVAGHRRRW